jgi:hypothetical protein
MCSVVREASGDLFAQPDSAADLHRRTQIKNKRWASDACLILICDYLRKSAAESGFSPAASGTEPGNRRPSNKSLPVTTGSCSWWIEITFSR